MSVTCRRQTDTLKHAETIQRTGVGRKTDRQEGYSDRLERQTDRQTDSLNQTREREGLETWTGETGILHKV